MALPLPVPTLHTVHTEFRYIFQNIAPFEDRTWRNFHRAQRRSMAHEWRSKVAVACSGVSGAPYGTRTRVSAVKGPIGRLLPSARVQGNADDTEGSMLMRACLSMRVFTGILDTVG